MAKPPLFCTAFDAYGNEQKFFLNPIIKENWNQLVKNQ